MVIAENVAGEDSDSGAPQAPLVNLGNGQLDAGEVYNVTYTDCVGSAGAASLNGSATLTVVSAAAGSIEVTTATSGIVVTLPQRVLTLNGSSTLSQTVVTNGASTTTTTGNAIATSNPRFTIRLSGSSNGSSCSV